MVGTEINKLQKVAILRKRITKQHTKTQKKEKKQYSKITDCHLYQGVFYEHCRTL